MVGRVTCDNMSLTRYSHAILSSITLQSELFMLYLGMCLHGRMRVTIYIYIYILFKLHVTIVTSQETETEIDVNIY